MDAMDHFNREEEKGALRQTISLVVTIAAGRRKRGMQACEIHRLSGGCYLWVTDNSNSLDAKIKPIGGSQVMVEGKRMWTNSVIVEQRVMEEKEGRN